MRVIRMSATALSDSTTGVFRLEGDFESRTGDFADDTVRDRYRATKYLTIHDARRRTTNSIDKLANEAIWLAENNPRHGKRIVVFVRKPEDAKAVAKAIREHTLSNRSMSQARNRKSSRTRRTSTRSRVLTGTMRGLERHKLVETAVLQGTVAGMATSSPMTRLDRYAGLPHLHRNARRSRLRFERGSHGL